MCQGHPSKGTSMTKDEALRLALEALEYHTEQTRPIPYTIAAIVKIKKVLLQQEAKDEPVAWLHRFIEGGISIGLKPLDLERHPERWEPLYTTPPQRKPLTDEEIVEIARSHACGGLEFDSPKSLLAFFNEAAHGIKGQP